MNKKLINLYHQANKPFPLEKLENLTADQYWDILNYDFVNNREVEDFILKKLMRNKEELLNLLLKDVAKTRFIQKYNDLFLTRVHGGVEDTPMMKRDKLINLIWN